MAVVKRTITTSGSASKKNINIGLFTNIFEYGFGDAPLNDIMTTDDSMVDKTVTAENDVRRRFVSSFIMLTNFVEYCFGEIPLGTYYSDKNRDTSKRSISTSNTISKKIITAS